VNVELGMETIRLFIIYHSTFSIESVGA
jgi:hypothetical protein